MNLLKAIGTIGGLTMISRVFGFARDMLASRILGAGMAADAFFVAFRLPNLFRRLFGEGAFSAGFVPLFSQRLHSPGGIDAAFQRRCSRFSCRCCSSSPSFSRSSCRVSSG
jgi:putative peptidoglycan lipid II flippase